MNEYKNEADVLVLQETCSSSLLDSSLETVSLLREDDRESNSNIQNQFSASSLSPESSSASPSSCSALSYGVDASSAGSLESQRVDSDCNLVRDTCQQQGQVDGPSVFVTMSDLINTEDPQTIESRQKPQENLDFHYSYSMGLNNDGEQLDQQKFIQPNDPSMLDSGFKSFGSNSEWSSSWYQHPHSASQMSSEMSYSSSPAPSPYYSNASYTVGYSSNMPSQMAAQSSSTPRHVYVSNQVHQLPTQYQPQRHFHCFMNRDPPGRYAPVSSTGFSFMPTNSNLVRMDLPNGQMMKPSENESFKLIEKLRPKKTRTKYTRNQIQVLEDIFTHNPYPDLFTIDTICQRLGGIPKEKIHIWFQNRRARNKRGNKPAAAKANDSDD